MRRRLLLCACLALAACGKDVRDIDDGEDGCFGDCEEPLPAGRLEVEGRVCLGGDRVVRTTKVLILLDRSGSWQFTDPNGAHFQAIAELLDTLGERSDTQVGIIAFNAGMEVTPFTRDRDVLDAALANAFASGQTDIQGALGTAARLIEEDVAGASVVERARTTYELVLVGDGLPDPICHAGCDDDPSCWGYCDVDPAADPDDDLDPEDFEGLFVDLVPCGDYNTDDAILAAVERLRALEQTHRLAAVRLHTVFVFSLPEPQLPPLCAGAPAYDRQLAEDLFSRIATRGGGLSSVAMSSDGVSLPAILPGPSGEELETRGLAFLSAWNLSAGPDSDADGLTDAEESAAGTNATLADTDADGYGDQLEAGLADQGFDPLDADAPPEACAAPEDGDGDGLADCEEVVLGTAVDFHDTDLDLIGDGHELRAGTDPLQDDVASDLDFDGMQNGDEVLAGLDPLRADAERWQEFAQRTSVREDGDGCYTLVVQNIELTTTATIGQDGRAGWNTILVEAVGTFAEDAPRTVGTPRTACVRARLAGSVREPEGGRVTLGEDAFRDPADLDLATDCVGP